MPHAITKNKQIVRFATVGIANTLIDVALLFILKSLGLPVITANIISSTTAFVFSFAANRTYTFPNHSGSIKRQVVLFLLVTLFGLWVIQNIIIWLTLPVAEQVMSNHSIALLCAKLVATIASLVWNFLLYRTVVFPER